MGMRSQNINMCTTVERKKLLETLRANLANHSKIIEEARIGYAEQAKTALLERLEQLKRDGTVSLVFSLNPPQDYSETYKSSIAMLEWNTQPEVELSADEFRQLVEDKWDWTHGFYAGNAQYSRTASAFFGGAKGEWK